MKKPVLWILLGVAAFIALGLSGFSQGADNEPPAGFVALFNGKDLAGWHGYDTKDPRKFQEMSAEDQQAAREKSLEDIKKHWTIQGADLVNDGNGLYLTTDKNYGDYELWIDYKTDAEVNPVKLRRHPHECSLYYDI